MHSVSDWLHMLRKPFNSALSVGNSIHARMMVVIMMARLFLGLFLCLSKVGTVTMSIC